MVHLVYFSPGTLGDPVVQTEAGPAALISCLRSLLQNCLLLDFKDYRFDDEVRSEVEKLPENVRKPVMSLLVQFKKRNRIVRAADDDYSGRAQLDLLAEQADRLGLELIIVQVEEASDQTASGVPRTSIVTYAMSHFEAQRSEDMADRHLKESDMPGDQFIERHLVPFLRFSQRLDIIDGSLGEHYREDYWHTIGRLFDAVHRVSACSAGLTITVHCRHDAGHKYVREMIDELARKHGLTGKVRVLFYGDSANRRGSDFKHDRCLVSEIGVVNIGRGFDFIHKPTGLLRETTIGFGGPDLDTILGPYTTARS